VIASSSQALVPAEALALSAPVGPRPGLVVPAAVRPVKRVATGHPKPEAVEGEATRGKAERGALGATPVAIPVVQERSAQAVQAV